MPQTGFSGGLFDHFSGHHQKKGCISFIAFLQAKSCSPASRKVTDPCAYLL